MCFEIIRFYSTLNYLMFSKICVFVKIFLQPFHLRVFHGKYLIYKMFDLLMKGY